jgi:hypothetical protein
MIPWWICVIVGIVTFLAGMIFGVFILAWAALPEPDMLAPELDIFDKR